MKRFSQTHRRVYGRRVRVIKSWVDGLVVRAGPDKTEKRAKRVCGKMIETKSLAVKRYSVSR